MVGCDDSVGPDMVLRILEEKKELWYAAINK